MARQTKAEACAEALCNQAKQEGSVFFSVEWTRSRTWGQCPKVLYRGDVAARASGCGYDKQSAALAEALSPLGETKEGRIAIGACRAAGLRALQAALAGLGWTLVQEYDGKREEGYHLHRAPNNLDLQHGHGHRTD